MSGFSLRNFLEETLADVNPFDGNKTGASVRAARQQRRPRPAQTPQPGTRRSLSPQRSAQINSALGIDDQSQQSRIKPITMPKAMTLSSVTQPKPEVPQIQKAAPVTTASVIEAGRQARQPKPAPQKRAPLPDQDFLEVSAGAPQPKKLFGVDVSKPLGQFGTTQKISANRTMSTNKDKYVAGFDRLHGDVKKVLVNQAKEKAARGDRAAQNTLRVLTETGRMKGDAMDFIEGSNERYLGGMARAALRTADFVVPGKDTLGMGTMADSMDSRRNGMRHFTDTGRAGELTGQIQKGAADAAMMVIPAVGTEKLIRGTQAIQNMAQGSKLARFGSYAASNAGGGLPATGIEMLQTIGRGQEIDPVKSVSLGITADITAPAIIRGGSKLVRYGLDKLKPAADPVVEQAAKAADVMQPAPVAAQAPVAPVSAPAGKVYEVPPTNPTDITTLSDDQLKYFADQGYTSIKDGFGSVRELKPTQAVDLPAAPAAPQYGMSHRPTQTGATADDITANDMGLPKDFYDHPEYYAIMREPTYKESFDALRSIKGNPDAEVTIYRAAPKGELNDGDWVTLSKKYAEQEALAEGAPVHSFKVKAKDVQFAGDDINEFGYFPSKTAPAQAVDTPAKAVEPEPLPAHVSDYAHSTSKADDIVEDTADYWYKHGKETKGGQLIDRSDAADPYGAEGGMTRISEHNQFYSEFYKKYKKPPTRADYKNEVRRQLEEGGGSMVDAEQSAAYQLVKQRNAEDMALANVRTDTTDFDDFLSRNGMDKLPPSAAAPAPAPAAKQKLSRFANQTVQGSDEVSTPLKGMVKDEQVSYDAVTNAGRAENAKAAIETLSDEKAFAKVIRDLDNPKAADGGQKEFNAIELAKRLDGRTDEGSLTMATEILHKLSENATKKGQEIQALAYLNNRTPQGLKFGAMRDLDKAGIEVTPEIKKTIDSLTEEIAKHPQGSDARNFAVHELASFVTKQVPVGLAPKIINFWRAGLLTAPTTTAGNILGNTGEAVVRKGVVDPVANFADYVMSKATGKRAYASNGGFAKGAKEGAGKLERFMKTGYDERNALSKYDSKELNYGDGKVGTAIGKYVNGTYRLMSLADQPFWYGARNEALANLAKVEWLNHQKGSSKAAKAAGKDGWEGLNTSTTAKALGYDRVQTAKSAGMSQDEFINSILDNPPKDLLEQATKEAKYATFQNETMLGSVASYIKKGAEKAGGDTGRAVADFFIPFTQVPAAIATRVVQRTPVGTGAEIVRQIVNTRKGKPFDQRAMAKAIGEGSFGSAVFAGGYALANSGQLTFGFPDDAKERELWEAEGKQPYSVKLGDRWYSLNYLQPFGTLLAVGGEAANAAKEGADPTETISRGIATAGQAVMNQSFLKGISGVLDAIDDPQRYAENYVENTSSSIVPNFIRSFARASDDVQRDQKGIAEGVQGAIPGLRQNLPAKTDLFGNDLAPKDNFANQYLNPLRPSRVKNDPVSAELRRLQDAGEGVIPTTAKKNAFDGHTLTREQISEINKRAGKAIQAEYRKLISDENYAMLSDKQKADSLRNINETVYGSIKNQYGAEIGIASAGDMDKKQKRYATGQSVDFVSKKKSDGTAAEGIEIHDSLDRGFRKTLADYSLMTTDEREDYFRGQKDAEYKYELAKAKNDELNGKLTKAEAVKTRRSLQKAKVGSEFDKDTREMYALSKTDLWDLVSNDPEGARYAEQIVAYGDALEAAGLGDNKFRNSKGEIAIQPTSRGSGGSGGRRGGRTAKSSKKYDIDGYINPVATGKSLRQILAEAKVGKA